jgi:hypothetical protein
MNEPLKPESGNRKPESSEIAAESVLSCFRSPVSGLSLSIHDHNAYHRHSVDSLRESAIWSALAGLALLPYKLTLPHGAWLPWVKANCEYCHRTATNHMRLAEKMVGKLGVSEEALLALDLDGYAALRERVAQYLTPERSAERAALIAALNPPPPEKSALPDKPAKPRAARPTGPRPLTAKAALPLVPRLRLAPPEVRAVIFTELRPEIEAWLQTEYAK